MSKSSILDMIPEKKFTTDPDALTMEEIARAKNISRSHAQKLVTDLINKNQVVRVFKKVDGRPISAYLAVEKKGKKR